MEPDNNTSLFGWLFRALTWLNCISDENSVPRQLPRSVQQQHIVATLPSIQEEGAANQTSAVSNPIPMALVGLSAPIAIQQPRRATPTEEQDRHERHMSGTSGTSGFRLDADNQGFVVGSVQTTTLPAALTKTKRRSILRRTLDQRREDDEAAYRKRLEKNLGRLSGNGIAFSRVLQEVHVPDPTPTVTPATTPGSDQTAAATAEVAREVAAEMPKLKLP
jgi:hypothetical protein